MKLYKEHISGRLINQINKLNLHITNNTLGNAFKRRNTPENIFSIYLTNYYPEYTKNSYISNINNPIKWIKDINMKRIKYNSQKMKWSVNIKRWTTREIKVKRTIKYQFLAIRLTKKI